MRCTPFICAYFILRSLASRSPSSSILLSAHAQAQHVYEICIYVFSAEINGVFSDGGGGGQRNLFMSYFLAEIRMMWI